jgi:pimeloyl-ACP methyl ester carboxylesterase
MADYADILFDTQDGLTLHAQRYGELDPDVIPIICLPGLTRNAADFHRFALALRSDPEVSRPVVAFSYRGRGRSQWDTDWQHYTVATELADLCSGLDVIGIHEAFVVGTSRGGLIAHFLNQVRPRLIRATVLNDIGPVVEREGLALIRNYLTGVRTSFPTLQSAAEAQRRIHGPAFPALSEHDWLGMAEAQYVYENGLYFSAFDPALAKTLPDNLDEAPLPAIWEQFDALAEKPLLVIRGENSKLLSERTVDEMITLRPNVSAISVAGQGHAPFLEMGDLPLQIGRFFNQA